MADEIRKKVDESWKEQAEREKHAVGGSQPPPTQAATPSPAEAPATSKEALSKEALSKEEAPQARFDLFVSGLAMEALIALGDVPHPVTRKQTANFKQAKYLIDVLGIIEEKTRNNLSVEEDQLLKDALYQLRMRYLAKAGS